MLIPGVVKSQSLSLEDGREQGWSNLLNTMKRPILSLIAALGTNLAPVLPRAFPAGGDGTSLAELPWLLRSPHALVFPIASPSHSGLHHKSSSHRIVPERA